MKGANQYTDLRMWWRSRESGLKTWNGPWSEPWRPWTRTRYWIRHCYSFSSIGVASDGTRLTWKKPRDLISCEYCPHTLASYADNIEGASIKRVVNVVYLESYNVHKSCNAASASYNGPSWKDYLSDPGALSIIEQSILLGSQRKDMTDKCLLSAAD